jgi:hypothetical protein
VVFDGDGFIFQVHGVFTCIRSGATVVASYGGAPGSKLYSAVAVCTGFSLDPLEWLRLRRMKNPKGFGFYL